MKISIEQYENLVALLKKALEFYADDKVYEGDNSLIKSDLFGSQARFALKKIDELEEINKKLEQEIIDSTNNYNTDDDDFNDIIKKLSM